VHSIVFRDAADVIALTICGFVIGEIRLQDLVEAIAKVYRRRSGPTKYDINSSWVSEIHQRLPEFQSAWEHSGPALLQGCPEVSFAETGRVRTQVLVRFPQFRYYSHRAVHFTIGKRCATSVYQSALHVFARVSV